MAKDRLKDLSELLSAYLDGELEESARAEVVAYLDRDAGAVRVLNELRETRSMLQDLPHQSAPAGFSESVVSAVERQALLGGVPDADVRMSTRRRWGPIRAAASIALLVGAAGSWIYWQSDRWKATDVALRYAGTADTSVKRATDRSIGLDALAVQDDAAEDASRNDQPRRHMKKSARGKTAAPAVPSAVLGSRLQSAEMEDAKQQQEQSIADGDLITPAGVDEDEKVVALGIELDAATVYSPTSSGEQVDFGLAGQLGGSRRRGAVRADFMRRLQANEPAVSLASYDFSNESNVLTMSFSSDAQRDEFTQKFEVYLVDNSFLSAADPRERILVVEPLIQNVLLRGHEGRNYAEPNSEQILLNAAPEVLEGLIDRYAETTVGSEDTTNIELQVGEMKVQGLESIRDIARAMAVPEVQRRILGKNVQTADKVDDAAADPDERRTAAQWRTHFARLGLIAKTKEGQASVAKPGGAEKDGGLAQSEDESGQTIGAAPGEEDGRGVSNHSSQVREAGRKETSEARAKVRQEEQAATAGEQDQGQVGAKKKKRQARSAKGRRADDIELFGGGAAGGGGGGGGRGGGGGGGDALKQLKRPGPSRPIGRASNLTFVLRLQTVPPATPKLTPEPTPIMGPPAPPSESDDAEK